MSLFDRAELVPPAPTWRCPHCRTLQPEASRCRACSRAAVTCSTCHRYRRSVAGDLAYCADDRARTPLAGDEVRSCWEQSPANRPAPGLFDEGELAPVAASQPPAQPSSPTPPAATEAGSRLPPLSALPDADPLPANGRLVDAPHVAPGRVLMSEIERRARGHRG